MVANYIGGHLNRVKHRGGRPPPARALHRDEIQFGLAFAKEDIARRRHLPDSPPAYGIDERTGADVPRSHRKRANGAHPSIGMNGKLMQIHAVQEMDSMQLRKLLKRSEGYNDLAGLEYEPMPYVPPMPQLRRQPLSSPARVSRTSPLCRLEPRSALRPISEQCNAFKDPIIYVPPAADDASDYLVFSEDEDDITAVPSSIDLDLPPSAAEPFNGAEPPILAAKPLASSEFPPTAQVPPTPAGFSFLGLTLDLEYEQPPQPIPYRIPLMADPACAAYLPWYFVPSGGRDIEDMDIPGQYVGADWRVGIPFTCRDANRSAREALPSSALASSTASIEDKDEAIPPTTEATSQLPAQADDPPLLSFLPMPSDVNEESPRPELSQNRRRDLGGSAFEVPMGVYEDSD